MYDESASHLNHVIELLCDLPGCKRLQQQLSAAREQMVLSLGSLRAIAAYSSAANKSLRITS